MKKFVTAALLTGVSAFLLVGCQVSDVNTGGSNTVASTTTQGTEQKAEEKPANEKRFAANQSAEAFGIKFNVAEIKITPDKIEVGMNMHNTNQHAMTLYPEQEARIVIGDMQIDANMFLGTGDLGGDIEGGVKKDGVLAFIVPEGKTLDLTKITQMKLKLTEVHTPDFMNTKVVEFNIPVK